MTPRHLCALSLVAILLVGALALRLPAADGWTLVGWNDLGMHCMDDDYSVFSILPPFNTCHAQLLDPAGDLTHDPAGVSLSYEAVADPGGSINTTSVGKTSFWNHVSALFGVTLAPDVGLAGNAMPGPGNNPQAMRYDISPGWYTAEGVPITPYDDTGAKNPYPMMRLVARDSSGNVLASTDVVLPVSDEMSCAACHASGSGPAARPAAGWVFDPNPSRDYRLNVLRLHDDLQGGNAAYQAALAQLGYNSAGLFATVTVNTRPILCASCHPSNALPGTGLLGISHLTHATHGRHASVLDPTNGLPLDASTNRTACYRCHPGSATRCLRGAMGHAVAPDGSLAIQCQSCHGSMSAVGDTSRVGWLDQPVCQSCHTGTAVHNNGQIRYTTVFDETGAMRPAVDATFATDPNVPAPGFSLYRFSFGHGGLACEACHGSTHAVFPSSHANDNVQSLEIQGHVGTLAECGACHDPVPPTIAEGPHGMHALGAEWVAAHGDAVESVGSAVCRACHGADDRGSVLSYSHADRTFTTPYGLKSFWRGFRIGCYNCHMGPGSDDPNPNRPPQVTSAGASTPAGTPATVPLLASDPDGNPLVLRIVSQPGHGTVGLVAGVATYFPQPGFAGTDVFTFAAWDGSTNSNLGSVTMTVHAAAIFADGFESGSTSAWSASVP